MTYGYYVSRDGTYHDGDQQPGDVSCPQRPSPLYTWDGSQWQPESPVAQTARLDAEATSDVARDKLIRTLFEVLYDHESRLRVIEAKAAVTKPQYRGALVAIYKGLP